MVTSVFRVEHFITGIGPYTQEMQIPEELVERYNLCTTFKNTLFLHSDASHPNVKREYSNASQSVKGSINAARAVQLELHFGFASMRQLHDWFTVEELKTLYKFGFYVRKYIDDSDVIYLSKQVLFNRCRSRLCYSRRAYRTSNLLRFDRADIKGLDTIVYY